MTEHTVITILSSSLVSGGLVALIYGLYLLRSKQNDYRNEFYKLVIQRRLAAYEAVENLISAFKTTVLDTNNDPSRPYHAVFQDCTEEGMANLAMLLYNVSSKGLWLSDAVFQKAKELDKLWFNLGKPEDLTEFGKEHYEVLALVRADLESLLARDMLTMYDVKGFLQSKASACHTFVPFSPKTGWGKSESTK
jgi:hypothetical protein